MGSTPGGIFYPYLAGGYFTKTWAQRGWGWSYLLVLLRLLPAPSPLQGFPFHAFIHQGVKGLAKHEVPVVEAPHTCAGEKETAAED